MASSSKLLDDAVVEKAKKALQKISKSVHMRFKDWCNKGIWKILFESMHDEADNEFAMMDATIVRAHAC